MLRLQHPVAVVRAVNRLDTAHSFVGSFERDVDTQRVVLAIRAFPIANRNLLNVAVLPKEFRFS